MTRAIRILLHPHTGILVGNKHPAIRIGNPAGARIREGLNFFCGEHVSAFDGGCEVTLFLVPIDGGIFANFPVKAHIQKQVQVAAGERFQKARVRAADFVPMEIPVRLFADFHEQFLVVHGAHELDSRILVEPGLFLELVEEGFVHVGNEREVLGRLAQHELANHGLVVVLGNKAAHYQVVFLGLQALFGKPARELFVVIGEAATANLGTVGNEGSLGLVLGVRFLDVLLDVLGIANEQVGMLDHVLLGILPVLAHGQGPLGTQPFMAIGVHVKLTAQLVDVPRDSRSKGANTAREAIHDGVRNLVFPDIVNALPDGVDVVEDRGGGTDVRDLHLETARVVVFELVVLGRLARDMVLETGVVLVIFRQFVDEGFVPAVRPGDTLAAYYENMLNICHKFRFPVGYESAALTN